MDCLLKEIKGSVQNNNLELFDAIVTSIDVTGATTENPVIVVQAACKQDASIVITLLEGNGITEPNGTTINAGESFVSSSRSGYFRATTNGIRKIKIEKLFNVSTFQYLVGITLDELRRCYNIATIRGAYLQIGSSRRSAGNVEPVVEYRAAYKETQSDFTILDVWGDAVLLNGNPVTATDGTLYIEATETGYNVRNKDVSGTIKATYTTSTNSWQYF